MQHGLKSIHWVPALVASLVLGNPTSRAEEQPPLSWGTPSEGLACGLSTTSHDIVQGDHLTVQLGLRFDLPTSPAQLGMLNDFRRSLGFVFENIATGEKFERDPLVFVGPGPPVPRPEDFVELRNRPVTMQPVSIALLTAEGEQLPAGTYRLTAWYENEGKPETIEGDCWMVAAPYSGPWDFWRGRITSGPIPIHVRPSEPAPEELQVNSGFVVKSMHGRTCWGPNEEDPLRITVTRSPGYYPGRKTNYYYAIGTDHLQSCGQGWGSVSYSGGFTCRLKPEEEARLAAGERLSLRSEIEIFETSEPPGHMWMPERGDYRVLWQGQIEGRFPAREH